MSLVVSTRAPVSLWSTFGSSLSDHKAVLNDVTELYESDWNFSIFDSNSNVSHLEKILNCEHTGTSFGFVESLSPKVPFFLYHPEPYVESLYTPQHEELFSFDFPSKDLLEQMVSVIISDSNSELSEDTQEDLVVLNKAAFPFLDVAFSENHIKADSSDSSYDNRLPVFKDISRRSFTQQELKRIPYFKDLLKLYMFLLIETCVKLRKLEGLDLHSSTMALVDMAVQAMILDRAVIWNDLQRPMSEGMRKLYTSLLFTVQEFYTPPTIMTMDSSATELHRGIYRFAALYPNVNSMTDAGLPLTTSNGDFLGSALRDFCCRFTCSGTYFLKLVSLFTASNWCNDFPTVFNGEDKHRANYVQQFLFFLRDRHDMRLSPEVEEIFLQGQHGNIARNSPGRPIIGNNQQQQMMEQNGFKSHANIQSSGLGGDSSNAVFENGLDTGNKYDDHLLNNLFQQLLKNMPSLNSGSSAVDAHASILSHSTTSSFEGPESKDAYNTIKMPCNTNIVMSKELTYTCSKNTIISSPFKPSCPESTYSLTGTVMPQFSSNAFVPITPRQTTDNQHGNKKSDISDMTNEACVKAGQIIAPQSSFSSAQWAVPSKCTLEGLPHTNTISEDTTKQKDNFHEKVADGNEAGTKKHGDPIQENIEMDRSSISEQQVYKALLTPSDPHPQLASNSAPMTPAPPGRSKIKVRSITMSTDPRHGPEKDSFFRSSLFGNPSPLSFVEQPNRPASKDCTDHIPPFQPSNPNNLACPTNSCSKPLRAIVAKPKNDTSMCASSSSCPNSSSVICFFCKKNGEMVERYTTHSTKDHFGRVLCPVLRAHRCEICGATGDEAHTRSHCPYKNGRDKDLDEPPASYRQPRVSNGMGRYSHGLKYMGPKSQ